jgi:hypothetical protein
MRPIGGWVTLSDFGAEVSPPTEPFRTTFSWSDNAGKPWRAFGSADKLFIVEENNSVHDATPSTLNFNPGGTIGYGSGAYGSGRYGISRPDSTIVNEDDVWVFDNWGENLLALHTGDGRLFEWNPNTPATEAAQVLNAPVGAKWMIVTNERHVMLFGVEVDNTINPRHITWSDRENNTVWAPLETNLAGFFNLQTFGAILAATRVPQGILVVTSEGAALVYFVGGNDVYGRNTIADSSGCVSGLTLVPIPTGAVWAGPSNFWKYEGSVEILPCDVLDFFYREGNLTRPVTIHAGLNEEFREVWFFRPNAGSAEPDEYVFWSFRDKEYWGKGTLSRQSMSKNAMTEKPLMTQGFVSYIHELGWLADGVSRTGLVFAESGDFEVGTGDRVIHAKKYFQDIDGEHPQDHLPFSITFKVRRSPMGQEVVKGPYTLDMTRGYSDVRFRARQAVIRVDQDEDEYWSMGTGRLQIQPGGRR